MNISTLAAFGVAGTIALLSVSQPIAEGATAASSVVPAKAKAKVRVRPVQVEAAPPVTRSSTGTASVIGPSVMGPSTAASAPGSGFGIIAAPYGAAASSPPPRDAGAPPDPKSSDPKR